MVTDPWGIDDSYHAVDGRRVETSASTSTALRTAMGAGRRDHYPPPTRPVWFTRAGTAPAIDIPAVLGLEDGTSVDVADHLPPDLPLGYHQLHPSDGGPPTTLIVTPPTAHPPGPQRRWGWALQLYATRSRCSWGMGDLGDLRDLASATPADLLGVSPIGASLPTAQQQPSPYYPSSRRWWNPLYLRIEDVPGAPALGDDLEVLAEKGRALLARRLIDRDSVWQLKSRALGLLWDRFRSSGGDPRFDRFVAENGPELARFGLHEALVELFGTAWPHWPGDHRHPTDPRVAQLVQAHAPRIAYHSWLQWLLDDQLASAARTRPLVTDLPVGVDPSGADAWCDQGVLARDVSVGAPPDEFNPAGQDWGLPPYVPWRLRDAAYAPFISTLRRSLRHVAGIRIDHVMGMFRLYWIPHGFSAADGAYVRHFGDEMLDLVALESARAGAFVVGEDLGTVEPEVRTAMADREVLGYRVGWFEDDPPPTWNPRSVAMMTTHDLPTVAGIWTGADLDQQEAAGLEADPSSLALLRRRLSALADDPEPATPPEEVAAAAYRSLAHAGSTVVLATLDDALGVLERPNMPGTTDQHPNWRLSLPVPVEDLAEHPGVAAITSAMSGRAQQPAPA